MLTLEGHCKICQQLWTVMIDVQCASLMCCTLSVAEWWQWQSKLCGHRGGSGGLFPEPEDGAAVWTHQLCTCYQQSGKVSLCVFLLESGYHSAILLAINETLGIVYRHFHVCGPRSKLINDMTHENIFHQIRDFVLFMKQQAASQHVQD